MAITAAMARPIGPSAVVLKSLMTPMTLLMPPAIKPNTDMTLPAIKRAGPMAATTNPTVAIVPLVPSSSELNHATALEIAPDIF